MNRPITSLSIVSITSLLVSLGSLGACSSSSTNAGGGGTDAGTANNDSGSTQTDSGSSTDDGGTGDDGATTDDAGDGSVTYDVKLTGAEVVPANIASSSGTAKFTLLADNVTLKYDITHTAQNATGVAIHLGAPGENGASLHTLTPVSSHMTGQITLTADESDKLAAGMLYVDVATQTKAAGELRAQLVLAGSEIFVSTASGSQEVPTVASSCHAHASFILNAAKDTVRYHFATDCMPTDVNLKKALGGMNGPVAFPLGNAAQLMDGTLTLTTADSDDLEQGHFYLNVVTNAHATGEVRGQVMMPGEKLFTSALSGATESPPVSTTATGNAQLILSADQKSVRYEAVVTGIIPTSIVLANAASGSNGPTLYTLTLGGDGAKGTQTFTANDASLLLGSKVYVNVKTASNPNGELRGQLATFPND